MSCGEQLITYYNCPLDTKFQDIWTHHNYIIYVLEGRKIYHTPHGSYDLREGSCTFIRSGASIVEQDFDGVFCLVLFFMTDEFICEVLQTKKTPIYKSERKFNPIINIHTNDAIKSFFNSMLPHFNANRQPDQAILDIKFRELVLNIADNPANSEILSCFNFMMQEPHSVTMQRVMEDNYCYNLRLEEYARLCTRSLSAFKRDFNKLYKTTPGKWLIEKRLDHALHLLTKTEKSVSDTAFESGFESASHFSRVFRQRFGNSPLAMRRLKVA
jgi:AraC-like DNA-binding protein